MTMAATSSSNASDRPRLAAIDWAMLETAVALGHMPIAGCELLRFREDAKQPVIPAEVVDLGLRGAPNFELLQLTRPDFILTSPFYTQYQARLERLAPVINLPFYISGEAPFPKCVEALTLLAAAIGDPSAAKTALERTEREFSYLRSRLAEFDDRPVCLINIGDSRHLRAFGYDSLFGSVLPGLGLANAWTGGTKFSFLAPVPIERLTEMPDARLVIVGEMPVQAERGLSRSILWRALPQVKAERVYILPDVNPFGGIPAARRFARLLADAFHNGPVKLA